MMPCGQPSDPPARSTNGPGGGYVLRQEINMTHLRLLGFALIAAMAVAACGGAEPVEITMTNGQGEIAGEVTATSVILQTRLTS